MPVVARDAANSNRVCSLTGIGDNVHFFHPEEYVAPVVGAKPSVMKYWASC